MSHLTSTAALKLTAVRMFSGPQFVKMATLQLDATATDTTADMQPTRSLLPNNQHVQHVFVEYVYNKKNKKQIKAQEQKSATKT